VRMAKLLVENKANLLAKPNVRLIYVHSFMLEFVLFITFVVGFIYDCTVGWRRSNSRGRLVW